MEGGNRRIDRVLDAAYLMDIESRSLPDVRTMRAEAEEEETLLSYERRLLHARMDILRAEQERRSGKAGTLLERLAEILADDMPPSRGSISLKGPPSLDNPRRRVERLVSDSTLTNLAELPNERIVEILTKLEAAEEEVSEQRHAVQKVLDALTAEVGRRYRTGEANPEDVLSGQ